MKEEILKVVSKKDPNSFHAIANLRDDLQMIDPYLIFKINDGTLNDEISYVFKSLKCAAQLAIEMDCEDIDNRICLKEEPVYCDTMHSRVDGYKNITAWVKNPITRSVMWIVTMEAKKRRYSNNGYVLQVAKRNAVESVCGTSLSTDFIKYSDDIPKLRRDRSITMQ